MKKILLSFVAILFSGAVFADNHGTYIGGSVGYTNVEDDEGLNNFQDNPVGWKVLGGYQFTQTWAVEGAYANLGEAEDTITGLGNVGAEFSGFSASAVGTIPMGLIDLFGKVGYYTGDLEVSVLGLSGDESDSGVTAGAGAKFNLIENFALRSDIDWYETDFDSLWSVNVGLTYNF